MCSMKNISNYKEQARDTRQSLIEKVKSYWPDLVINEGNLQKPTQNFVYKFYSEFYSEYEKNLFEIKTNLLKQEPEQVLDSNTYTDEIYLGIKLKKISKQLNETMPFYLNDIFEPQPRRTVLFFSVFMNLLIYMKTDTEYVDEICEVVNKAENFQVVYQQKQAFLEEIKDMNLLHVKLEGNIKKLMESIENISHEYKDMLMQKAEKEYDYQNDVKLKIKLKDQVDCFDKYLIRLREESTMLQEQLVEEFEIEVIKNKISTLEKELENVDVDRSTIVSSLEEQKENTNYYNKCLQLLQHPEFKSNTFEYLKSSIESTIDINQGINKLKEEINNKIIDRNELKTKQIYLNEKIILAQEKLSGLKIKTENSIKELIHDFTILAEGIQTDQNESRNLENDIVDLQSMISLVKEDEILLKASVMEEYSKLIEYQAKIYNSFNNALINICNYQNRY